MASIISHSAADTFELGRKQGTALRGGEVFALVGELGAGKTHFVKGLAKGIGYEGVVTSPTFTLVHEYRLGRFPLYHIDFYRLDSEEDAARIGLDDYLGSNAVTVIEWADKFARLLPKATRWVRFRFVGETREIVLG